MQFRWIHCSMNKFPFHLQNAFQYLISRDYLALALPRIRQSLSADIVCDLSRKDDFQAAILSKNHIPKLLPGGESWFPYEITGQDLNALMSYNKLYSVRYNKERVSSSPENTPPCSLGYQYTCGCPVGVWSLMYMWCNNLDEYIALFEAMLSHVTRITAPGSAIVMSVVSLGAAAEDILDFTEPFLGKPHTSTSETDAYKQGFLSKVLIEGTISKLWS